LYLPLSDTTFSVKYGGWGKAHTHKSKQNLKHTLTQRLMHKPLTWEGVQLLSVQGVANANLHFIHVIQDVQLGHCQSATQHHKIHMTTLFSSTLSTGKEDNLIKIHINMTHFHLAKEEGYLIKL
jgi:hypothetical protein